MSTYHAVLEDDGTVTARVDHGLGVHATYSFAGPASAWRAGFPVEPHCYGCGVTVEDAPGVAYCDECVAKQTAALEDERRAFDAYHAFADRVARGSR